MGFFYFFSKSRGGGGTVDRSFSEFFYSAFFNISRKTVKLVG